MSGAIEDVEKRAAFIVGKHLPQENVNIRIMTYFERCHYLKYVEKQCKPLKP